MSDMTLELRVNGTLVQVEMEGGEATLLMVLREHLGLTGCKPGCGEGECGACTIVLDGKAVRSCVTEARHAQGKDVLTIEGLEANGQLHPLQQAFLDNGAFQCGYCTPGMIMSALALLNACSNPRDDEIVEAMQGNICRCGTYLRIVRAIRQAALALRPESLHAEKASGDVLE
jgi:aerobic-type carbon monoxide dehydrogenase small subunit (CoxS/CutS family)